MRKILGESGFGHHLYNAAVQWVLDQHTGHRRHTGRHSVNEKTRTPMQEQSGDQKRENVVIQIEDDGWSLLSDFAPEVGNAEKRNDKRQDGTVFQPFAGSLPLRAR